MTTYSVDIQDGYVPPEGPIADNAGYVNFVMNMAAKSYQSQYNTPDAESGITAAREAYNASLPAPAPAPEGEE